jgi:hypothetical protein
LNKKYYFKAGGENMTLNELNKVELSLLSFALLQDIDKIKDDSLKNKAIALFNKIEKAKKE